MIVSEKNSNWRNPNRYGSDTVLEYLSLGKYNLTNNKISKISETD